MRNLIIILTLISFLSCNRKDEIPKELTYSFEYINEVWSPEETEIFKNIKENEMNPNHWYLGIKLNLQNDLLRNHAKSDSIVAYFNSLGITNYGYMSDLIMHSYRQYLNDENVYIQDRVDEIRENEKPYIECINKQKINSLSKFNMFRVNDTINVKMPVGGNNSVYDFGCPNLDWEFRKSFDLSIDGIITDKYYTKDSIYGVFIVKVISKNHPETKILYEVVNVGSEFQVSVFDTAWKVN